MKWGGRNEITNAEESIELVVLGGSSFIASCFIPSQSYLYFSRALRGLGVALLAWGVFIWLRDLRSAYKEVLKDADKKTTDKKTAE